MNPNAKCQVYNFTCCLTFLQSFMTLMTFMTQLFGAMKEKSSDSLNIINGNI